MGSFIMTTCPLMHHILCGDFWQNIQPPRWQPPYSPDLEPWNFWLFPKVKSPLKGKRFQTFGEIQENIMGKLMVPGRTVWGPKVPTFKGTEESLSYVQCFLYLLSSSVNVSIFHITWLDTFWIDHVQQLLSAERKAEILPFATTWMDLKSIMLSEKSQTKQDKYHII